MICFFPILYLTFYALLHSVLAMDRTKTHLYRLIPQPYYRLTYSILSLLLLFPIPLLPWPSGYLYRVPSPISYLFYLIQILGLIGFLWSARHTALGDFLGWAHLKSSHPKTQLLTSGPYRLCRHPLYFFGTLIFVAQPHMSYAHLIITLWLILYFWIGSYIEETRLLDQFGNAYQSYQETTPRFLPYV